MKPEELKEWLRDELEQAIIRGGEQYARGYVEGLEDGWEIAERHAQQQIREKEKELREQMLLQFGEFMWLCSDANEDDERYLAIGYDENGMPDSVNL